MIDCKLLQKSGLLAVAFVSGLAICASGRAAQEQTFDWQATNDQSVRLDPSGYHTGQVFKSSDQFGDNRVGNVHVDIEAQEPITVEMAPTGEWSEALRHPELLPRISFRCIREHVMKMTYACEVPAGRPMTLVVRDERDGGRTANVGFGAGWGRSWHRTRLRGPQRHSHQLLPLDLRGELQSAPVSMDHGTQREV